MVILAVRGRFFHSLRKHQGNYTHFALAIRVLLAFLPLHEMMYLGEKYFLQVSDTDSESLCLDVSKMTPSSEQ